MSAINKVLLLNCLRDFSILSSLVSYIACAHKISFAKNFFM